MIDVLMLEKEDRLEGYVVDVGCRGKEKSKDGEDRSCLCSDENVGTDASRVNNPSIAQECIQ